MCRPNSPHPDASIVRCGKYVRRVGCDVVDGGVVRLHMSYKLAGGRIPHLDLSAPTPRNDGVTSGKESESAYPLLVSIVQGFYEALAPQIPLLDAGIAGGRKQSVAGDCQALDPVVVWWVEVHLGRDDATLILRNVKHLDVVVFGASDDMIVSI